MTAEAPIETASAAGRPPRYTSVAVLLHWPDRRGHRLPDHPGLADGRRAQGPATYAIFQLHKSIGITILLLSLARWPGACSTSLPPHPVGQPRWGDDRLQDRAWPST